MARTYRTIDGEMIDAIAARELGGEEFTVALYEANRGLAELGPVLPMGTLVTIPDLPKATEPALIRLWGDA